MFIKYKTNKLPYSVQNAQENTFLGVTSNTISIDDSRHRAKVMWLLLIFGSTTFFGIPIVKELYSNQGGLLAANVWNMPQVFLFTFCFMQMKGLKFNRVNLKISAKSIFLNPIIISTFLGLILWLSQLLPHASVTKETLAKPIYVQVEKVNVTLVLKATYGENFKSIYGAKVDNTYQWYIYDNFKNIYKAIQYHLIGWFEWKITMPYLYTSLRLLANLASPLVWVAIDVTLAQSSLKKAIRDKWIWIYVAIKLIVILLGIFLIFYGLNQGLKVQKNICLAMVVFACAPPSAIPTGFAIAKMTVLILLLEQMQ